VSSQVRHYGPESIRCKLTEKSEAIIHPDKNFNNLKCKTELYEKVFQIFMQSSDDLNEKRKKWEDLVYSGYLHQWILNMSDLTQIGTNRFEYDFINLKRDSSIFRFLFS